MLKIRRPLGRLIFNMGIAIPGKTVFLIETAPCIPELAGLPNTDPIHLDMTGCWQINSILANIGRKNSIRILNLYPFLWNILIWA